MQIKKKIENQIQIEFPSDSKVGVTKKIKKKGG